MHLLLHECLCSTWHLSKTRLVFCVLLGGQVYFVFLHFGEGFLYLQYHNTLVICFQLKKVIFFFLQHFKYQQSILWILGLIVYVSKSFKKNSSKFLSMICLIVYVGGFPFYFSSIIHIKRSMNARLWFSCKISTGAVWTYCYEICRFIS